MFRDFKYRPESIPVRRTHMGDKTLKGLARHLRWLFSGSLAIAAMGTATLTLVAG